MFYKQCELRKNDITQVAWIPEHYAHAGDYLEIKGDDGWQVMLVGQFRMEEADVSMHSQDYKHQRKASDI